MSTETATQPQTGVKKFEEGTVDSILKRVSDFQTAGELVLPPNYIPENAVRSAWLELQQTVDMNKKPALDVCTRESIANAFLEMVTKGLSVVKKQCYFVVYGNKLELEESYLGKIARAKRDIGVKEVNPVTVYSDDVFEYKIHTDTGRKEVIKHEQKLQNIDPEKIVGAYAIVNYTDGSKDVEIMTFPQIQKSWAMGGAKGNSPAHKNFPDQMAEKTVSNRALKIELGSSDDSTLLRQDPESANVQNIIKQNANKRELVFEEAQVLNEEQVPEKPKQTIQPSESFEEPVKSEATEGLPAKAPF